MDSPSPEIRAFPSANDWEQWLAKNWQLTEGIWLQIYKKDSAVATITYKEALDVALCWGWIDGQKRSHDEHSWLQRFSPRRKRSVWSQINTGHIARLTQEGRMQEPGLKEVEAAKADGRWDVAYAPQSSAEIPDDFQDALDTNPQAEAFFATLNKVNRYALIYRIQSVKRPETRQKKIALFIEMLAKGETIHPQG
jgi:uncharacterized protein YdeI (YjbR/CyaY-like superfamily)